MPVLRHDRPYDVYCAALHVMVPAGEGVEVSEEDAKCVSPHVFHIESSAKPVRKSARRGGKSVEVTDAPVRETR